jgi:hypothetical protein
MSRTSEVYVASTCGLESLVSTLESQLGLSFRRYEEDWGPRYEAYDGQIGIVVLEHDLVDDRDMEFSRYPYEISVEGLDQDPVIRETQRQDYARMIYDKLTALGLYSLMLTEDAQKKVAEYRRS